MPNNVADLHVDAGGGHGLRGWGQTMLTAACPCPTATHERRCARARIDAQRGRLYDGLYDGVATRRVEQTGKVRLLNPALAVDDATARRFALLEID